MTKQSLSGGFAFLFLGQSLALVQEPVLGAIVQLVMVICAVFAVRSGKF